MVHRCMGMALVEVCWNRGARCVNSKRLSSIRCRCKGSCLQLANSVNERYHRQDEETTKTMMSKDPTRMEVPSQEAGGSECPTFHACARLANVLGSSLRLPGSLEASLARSTSASRLQCGMRQLRLESPVIDSDGAAIVATRRHGRGACHVARLISCFRFLENPGRGIERYSVYVTI